MLVPRFERRVVGMDLVVVLLVVLIVLALVGSVAVSPVVGARRHSRAVRGAGSRSLLRPARVMALERSCGSRRWSCDVRRHSVWPSTSLAWFVAA